jgi:hypothetical protein
MKVEMSFLGPQQVQKVSKVQENLLPMRRKLLQMMLAQKLSNKV